MNRLGLDKISLAALKTGATARLLAKPAVSRAFACLGSGIVHKADLALLAPVEQCAFVISFGVWGNGARGYDQTTRNRSNLVLQLNFNRRHDEDYLRLVKPEADERPFTCSSHPVARSGRNTLAWVRMDIEFSTGEVLVEEVQNDWLRASARILARWRRHRVSGSKTRGRQLAAGINGSYEHFVHYVECILQPYRSLWAQAALLATLRFVKDELGLATIYYHSFVTGMRLKAISSAPPKSLYTQLPREFGFELTSDVPRMLAEDKFARRYIKAIASPTWFRLHL